MADRFGTNLYNLFGWSFKKDVAPEKPTAPYLPKVDDDAAFVLGGSSYGYNVHALNLEQTFDNENDLIRRYRDLSIQPEPDRAINEIVNEAVHGDNTTCPVKMVLDGLKESDAVKEKIAKEFDTIVELLEFTTDAYEIFRKWYVDGRLYYHIIIDPNQPEMGIQELRYISALQIKKVREEIRAVGVGGVEYIKEYKDYYVYRRADNQVNYAAIKLSADSVCYVHSGLPDEDLNIVRGWLHKAMKPANQLRMIEDAVVIYRLARAPERRIWYIDVGNLPKQKAEEYMKNIMARHKNKMVYDAQSGEVKDSANVLSMMEDIWLPRREGGKGTEVDTLKGGENLGEISDIDYFKKKLYQSLNVPDTRMSGEDSGAFNFGKVGEITQDEVNFSKFIKRLRTKFSILFYSLLRTQLILKNIITEDEWPSIKRGIRFDFISDIHFTEMNEMELSMSRLNLLTEWQPFVGQYTSKESLFKTVLRMDDEEIAAMKSQMAKEIAAGEINDPTIVPIEHGGQMLPPEEPLEPESDK